MVIRSVGLLLGGWLAAAAQPGPMLFDFEAGFSLASVQTWGAAAALQKDGADTRLLVTPAAGAGWKGVTLSLPARDLGAHLGVAMLVTNPTAKGLGVHAHIDDTDHNYPSNQGYAWLEPGGSDTLYVHFHRKNPPAYLGSFLKGMRGLPGGFTDHWEIINTAKVDQVKLSMFSPEAGRAFTVDRIQAWGNLALPSEAQLQNGYFPLLDTLGQFRHGSWPGKAANGQDLINQASAEAGDLAAHPGPADWNSYGGWTGGPAQEATGRFRTAKVDSRWWLVTPDGRLFWSHGITCVGNWETTPTAGRENYFAAIPASANFRGANLKRKFGADYAAKANAQAHQRLRSWGMNTIANWSDQAIYGMKRTPYTVNYASVASPALPGALDTAALRAEARKKIEALKAQVGNDPWCLGVFSDNELAWPAATAGQVAEDYYRINSQEVKAGLPGLLYLGSRIHVAPEAVWRAAGKYCDVVSMNRYEYLLAEMGLPADVDKPALLTEFHFGALDRGLPHPGLRSVFSQRQRAVLYADMVSQALAHPKLVGAHWFQYGDQVFTGRNDGENYQIGFVDILDKPYPEMVAAARTLGSQLYRARNEGSRPGNTLSGNGRLALRAPASGRPAVDILGRRIRSSLAPRLGPRTGMSISP